MKPLEESGEKPLRVSRAPAWQVKKAQPDVLYEGQYRRITKKGECPQTKPAVVTDGREAGTILHVCRDEKCPVHARETRYQPTPQERAARAKELLAERIEKQSRVRILNAIRKKLPGKFARPDLEMASLDYFRRLGHDNHRRLCRVYGWEEKKSKAAWGGTTVDYEAIAGKAVREMNAQDLQRFLVVCALASDLYCPGYNTRQPLAKDSNLARAAARYKIDTTKLSAAVREEFLKSAKGTTRKKSKTTRTKSKQRTNQRMHEGRANCAALVFPLTHVGAFQVILRRGLRATTAPRDHFLCAC
jgi:hypothetical protein